MRALILIFICGFFMSCASNPAKEGESAKVLKWTGEIMDDSSTHTTRHTHDLKFIKSDTGERFSIVDSPEIQQYHHQLGKYFIAEIEGEKTDRFLFWGDNLVVKKFKVIQVTSDTIPHTEPIHRPLVSRVKDRF